MSFSFVLPLVYVENLKLSSFFRSFPFIAGTFATFVVMERESKAKHLQTVAGVNPVAYWLSTYIWDILNYQIPLWITVILMFVFDVTALTTTTRGVVGGIIVLLMLYGPASAGFAYCVSFMFQSPSMCNLVIIICKSKSREPCYWFIALTA